MCCFTYNYVFSASGGRIAGPGTNPNINLSRSNMEAAGALGVLCIITGIVYLIDFFYLLIQRSTLLANEGY